MKSSAAKKKSWLWLGLLLLLFLICSYFILSKQPKEFAPFDSKSPSPSGIKAFYTYLDHETFDVDRWEQPSTLLPETQGRQLLLMVEPYFIPDTEAMEAYISFMEKGNTILLMKTNPRGFFDLQTTFVQLLLPETTVFDSHEKRHVADTYSTVRMDVSEDDEVLLSDLHGAIAVKRTYGDGSLIVSLAPNWLMNGEILAKDHLPLILGLLQEEGVDYTNILFDEFNHGEIGSTSLDVYQDWFLLLLFQSLLMACFLLWMLGKRFGPILHPREETVRFSDESIRALAAWHLKGNAYHHSLLTQANYVKYSMQDKWGVPFNKDWKDCDGILYRKWKSKDNEEIDLFLHQLTTMLGKEKISKQEYLLWSKQLDTLRNEVEEG
ncbi:MULTISPECIES: DUF4350 domain-containing protein [unclassified Sutcliffiella]|uniref:DUF4350 domain-containing protein n=1 Tax=unclassified Sutcliffiella TaxID=2837532 RepID=UPI0030CC07F6